MSDAVHYDPYSASMHEDPFPTYRRLRDEAPLYHSEELGFWALSRFDDVRAAASDWRVFISGEGVDLDDAGRLFGLNSFLDMDPPRHDALRAVVRAWFTPKAVRELEARTREVVADLLAPLARRGHGDLAYELAWPLPLTMVGELLGLPAADRDFVRKQFELLVSRNVGDPALPPGVHAAAGTLREYFAEQTTRARASKGGTLLGHLVAAEDTGVITCTELLDMCLLLFTAAFETTASLISNSLLLLAEHEHQRRILVRDPSLIAGGLEELIRFQAPVPFLTRVTTKAQTLHGRAMPCGARVLLLFQSANRDERRFVDPDRLDVTRSGPNHVGFGYGIHFCLGAHLARLEGRVALAAVLKDFPEYQIASAPRRTTTLHSWGLASLPVTLTRSRL